VSARHRRAPAAAWWPPIAVEQLPVPRPPLYELWQWARRPAVQRATGPVDVIHATGVIVPPKTAPLVVTVHDLAYLHEPEHFTRRGVRLFNRAFDLTRRDATLVLCSSRATMTDCAQRGIDAVKLRYVPLGVTIEPATPDDVVAVTAQHRLSRYILFVGTIEPRKNLRGLLDAFRLLGRSDLQLAVVGPPGWNEELTPHLQGLGDRVRLTGFVDGAELRALYAGAAAVCLPSLREGFGLPVLEAMAQGTPVVTSSGTATEELVEGGAGVAVDPRDPQAIADALASVLDDERYATSLSAAGRARAAEWSWARTAEATIAAYREAVK
jgi:glycosyltransferase involved in cell wall biosynthesis